MMEAHGSYIDLDEAQTNETRAEEVAHLDTEQSSIGQDAEPRSPQLSLVPGEGSSLDSRQVLLDNASTYRRLTPRREVELGRVVQAGLKAQVLLDTDELTGTSRSEEVQKVITAGEAARKEFAEGNLLLIVEHADHAKNSPGGSKLGFDELYQEGFLGLNHAITKFDPEKGFKFSTYATWWIRQYIQRAIQDKSRTVRLPVNLDLPLRTVSALDDKRTPDAEIMEKAGVTQAELIELRNARQRCDQIKSLDKPMRPGDSDSPSRGDFVVGSLGIDLDALEDDADAPLNEVTGSEAGGVPAYHEYVDVSELSEFSLGVLKLLEPIITPSDYRLIVKEMYGERLEDADHRMRSRVRSLFSHPAIRAELNSFYSDHTGEEKDWRDQAACIGEAELYAKPRGNPNKDKVREICGGCAVRAECKELFETTRPLRAQWIDGVTYTKSVHKALTKKREARAAKSSV